MKSGLARYLDSLFIAAAVWLFSAIIALYFLDSLHLVIMFATAVTLGISFLLNLRKNRTFLAGKELREAESMAEYFLYRGDAFALDYFFDALSVRYAVTRQGDFLRINDTLIVPYFCEPLPLKKAVYFFSEALKSGAKTLVILTDKTAKFPFPLNEKLTDLRLEIFAAQKTLKLLKSLGKTPVYPSPAKKRRLRSFALVALNPSRTRHYLFTAFALLFGAYFTTMSLYFIIMAAVCLTLVVLSRLNIAEKIEAQSIKKNNN